MGVMRSHGSHVDVTDLKLSPIMEKWSHTY